MRKLVDGFDVVFDREAGHGRLVTRLRILDAGGEYPEFCLRLPACPKRPNPARTIGGRFTRSRHIGWKCPAAVCITSTKARRPAQTEALRPHCYSSTAIPPGRFTGGG